MIFSLLIQMASDPFRFWSDLWETGGLSAVYDTCLQCETCGHKPVDFDDMMAHIREHEQATDGS
jgi:hypothetical protein